MKTLEKVFEQTGKNFKPVRAGINDLIIKTLISCEQPIVEGYDRCTRHPNLCFEIYGFDVIIDSDLKPWLLEVNISPSFSSSSPFDKNIKTRLACDALTLSGIRLIDHEQSEVFEEAEARSRMRTGNLTRIEETQDEIVSKIKAIDIENPTDEEREVIMNYEEEGKRQGNFTRIFPL